MNYAIDLDSIIENILQGFADATGQPTLEGSSATTTIDPYPQDIGRVAKPRGQTFAVTAGVPLVSTAHVATIERSERIDDDNGPSPLAPTAFTDRTSERIASQSLCCPAHPWFGSRACRPRPSLAATAGSNADARSPSNSVLGRDEKPSTARHRRQAAEPLPTNFVATLSATRESFARSDERIAANSVLDDAYRKTFFTMDLVDPRRLLPTVQIDGAPAVADIAFGRTGKSAVAQTVPQNDQLVRRRPAPRSGRRRGRDPPSSSVAATLDRVRRRSTVLVGQR